MMPFVHPLARVGMRLRTAIVTIAAGPLVLITISIAWSMFG